MKLERLQDESQNGNAHLLDLMYNFFEGGPHQHVEDIAYVYLAKMREYKIY